MNPWALWFDRWENYIDAWSKAVGGDIFRLHTRNGDDASAIKQGATPFSIALEGENFALLDFSNHATEQDRNKAPPTIIVTPYALHDWRVADLAHHHSLVETLAAHGVPRLYVLAWKSANFKMRHNRIDAQFAAFKDVSDYLDVPFHCVGLCQGGWLSLAFAARFPKRMARLALIGSPVDFSHRASAIDAMDDNLIDASINWLSLAGGGVIRGWSTQSLWHIKYGDGSDRSHALQEPVDQLNDNEPLRKSYDEWDEQVLDLPPAYFADVLKHLYRDNDMIKGRFKVLGECVSLASVICPILMMTGCHDDIVPEHQILAVKQAVSTPPDEITILQADCGHLALFLGRKTLQDHWPHIAHWLRQTAPSEITN